VTPRPRRTVVVVLLAAGGLVTGLAGCSSAGPSADATQGPTETAAALPSGDPTAGVDVAGDGYTLVAPSGWEDSTETVKARFDKVDKAAGDTSVAGGFADNVNVIVSDKRKIKTQRKAERILRRELALVGKDVRVEEPIELDGEEAFHATARLKVGRIKVRTSQFFAEHEGTWYLLTFSYGPQTDVETEAEEVQGMLESWRWDD
jgi:hypothetical protein